MCIAIVKPENLRLYKRTLQNCFLHHSDGAGFVVHHAEENRLSLHKGYFTFEEFWKAIKPFMLHRMLIHFRWATHGEKNEENCHPYMVNDNLAFVHNGVIREVRQWDKTMSDTWHFGQAIMKPLVDKFPEIWKNKALNFLVEDYIGKNSKLIFMDNFGEIRIINEAAGIWDTQCWFSNTSYQKPPDKPRERKNKNGTTTTTTTTSTSTTSTSTTSTPVTRHYSYRPEATSVRTDLNAGVDEPLSEFYSGQDKSRDELLLESLFKECEEEEINRDIRIQRAQEEGILVVEGEIVDELAGV